MSESYIPRTQNIIITPAIPPFDPAARNDPNQTMSGNPVLSDAAVQEADQKAENERQHARAERFAAMFQLDKPSPDDPKYVIMTSRNNWLDERGIRLGIREWQSPLEHVPHINLMLIQNDSHPNGKEVDFDPNAEQTSADKSLEDVCDQLQSTDEYGHWLFANENLAQCESALATHREALAKHNEKMDNEVFSPSNILIRQNFEADCTIWEQERIKLLAKRDEAWREFAAKAQPKLQEMQNQDVGYETYRATLDNLQKAMAPHIEQILYLIRKKHYMPRFNMQNVMECIAKQRAELGR